MSAAKSPPAAAAADPAAPAKKKKGGLLVKLLLAVVLVAAGGGGAFALLQSGIVGGGGKAEKVDNRPKLVRQGEEDPYAPPVKEGEGAVDVPAVGTGSPYRTAYYSFADEFTSNLKNSDGLVQVSLAAATRRDGRVLIWMQKHELAIRSALLAVLADTPEEDVYSMDGKQRLQKRLTAAINEVLTRNEGFGGVDAVYFKSFLVQ